jgi:hypothetical protein
MEGFRRWTRYITGGPLLTLFDSFCSVPPDIEGSLHAIMESPLRMLLEANMQAEGPTIANGGRLRLLRTKCQSVVSPLFSLSRRDYGDLLQLQVGA